MMGAATAPPSAAGNQGKTVRRNLMYLCTAPDGGAELDRFMIALWRFQTEGKVAYRRILGMHGGGGGTSDKQFEALLDAKMKADLQKHYDGKFPDEYYWPEPVPNAPYPEKMKAPHAFTYTFCWHAEPQFIVWHRPLTAEFERLLQDYDPQKFDNEEERHQGPKALGLPYWGWESWDGLTLPLQVSQPTYTIRTNQWEAVKQGEVLPNPLYRWFAPVSLEMQRDEKFPPAVTDANCTTRSVSFTDPSVPHEMPWNIVDQPPKNPAMWNVVNRALAEPDYMKFATMKSGVGGAQYSIENAHNKFHNHIGGFTLGGIQGPGKQVSPLPADEGAPPNYFTGTMAQNQSIFDPIFWLHHCNVERQLCSWQQIHYRDGKPRQPKSMPPSQVLDTVLYPWTKPDLVKQGQVSWNTPVSKDNDGTFKDWWLPDLTYVYDEYLLPLETPGTIRSVPLLALTQEVEKASARAAELPGPPSPRVRLIAHLRYRLRGGEFTLLVNGEQQASLAVLSAWGTGCARCAQRDYAVDFEVTHFLSHKDDLHAVQNNLTLLFNGTPVEVASWAADHFEEETVAPESAGGLHDAGGGGDQQEKNYGHEEKTPRGKRAKRLG